MWRIAKQHYRAELARYQVAQRKIDNLQIVKDTFAGISKRQAAGYSAFSFVVCARAERPWTEQLKNQPTAPPFHNPRSAARVCVRHGG